MTRLKKKEQVMAVILALLMILFGFLIWYFGRGTSNLSGLPAGTPVVREAPIKLNNTLKTSVTVLPAPGAEASEPQQ